jgi:hypothetical protein
MALGLEKEKTCVTLPMSITQMDDIQLKQHITPTSVSFYHDKPKELQVEAVTHFAWGEHCFVRVGTG